MLPLSVNQACVVSEARGPNRRLWVEGAGVGHAATLALVKERTSNSRVMASFAAEAAGSGLKRS
jgi:hypothetical protein